MLAIKSFTSKTISFFYSFTSTQEAVSISMILQSTETLDIYAL